MLISCNRICSKVASFQTISLCILCKNSRSMKLFSKYTFAKKVRVKKMRQIYGGKWYDMSNVICRAAAPVDFHEILFSWQSETY